MILLLYNSIKRNTCLTVVARLPLLLYLSFHTTFPLSYLSFMEALGTVANIFGLITPAKDVVEVIKSIAGSIEEVRNRILIHLLLD